MSGGLVGSCCLGSRADRPKTIDTDKQDAQDEFLLNHWSIPFILVNKPLRATKVGNYSGLVLIGVSVPIRINRRGRVFCESGACAACVGRAK